MAKQTFTTGQVLTAAQMNSLQSNDFNQTVSVKTASYTLVAADKGTRIEFNTSGSVTCTVNTGLFDAGDTVIIQNRGAGTVTVTAGTATVNTNASLAVAQYGYGTLYFISASASIFFADAGGIPASAFTAKGDVLVGTGSGTYDKLGVGANGTTIVADSSTSTGLKWAAPSTGALVLITTQSFSGSGTINVNDVFSGTYDNYLVKMNYEGSGGTGSAFEMRMRVSGADNTNASYAYQRQTTGNTTVSAARFTGQTIWEVGQAVTGDPQWVEFNFYQPFASAETGLIASSNGNGSTPEWWVRLGVFDNTTSFTGFSIISQRNLAGSLSVYGYAK